MITDDERREMANELRRQAAYSSGSLGEWWQRLQEIVTGEIDFANPQETYRAIADLIDRPTCRNVSGYEDVFECSECRCKVDLTTEVCDEHGKPFHVPLMPSFCPNCGEEVVG